MKKKIPLLTVITFLTTLFLVSILNVLIPEKNFSSLENRYLSKLPAFYVDELLQGTYIPKLETWFNDQFIARDSLVSIKSFSDLMLGFGKSNHVYFGKDGYLFTHVEEIDESIVEKNIALINTFAKDKTLPMYFIAVPEKYSVMSNHLPANHYDVNDVSILLQIQSKLSSNIQYIDAYQALLNHQKEAVYYKTDHHWSALGAYYTYSAYLASKQQQPSFPLTPELVKDDFKGTLYAKSKAFWYGSDELYIYDRPEHVAVELDENGEWYQDVYFWNHIKERDAYAFFLDGNHAITKIKTEAEVQKHILVIKDSFAHNFVPYLTHDASMITMIDLRYYKKSISDYVEANDVDEIIFLYGMDSLIQQVDLSFLK